MSNRRGDLLVTPEWLAAHIADPGLVVLDAALTKVGTTTPGPEIYLSGHIPGAHHFDIRKIVDSASPLPATLPPPEVFEGFARGFGISKASTVVVYDTDVLYAAGRVWWTLRFFGHEDVRILDGGLKAWVDAGFPVTTETPPVGHGDFVASSTPSLLRTKSDLLANIESQDEQVVDARIASHFTGDGDPMPGLRRGHIPGSVNLPVFDLSDPETGKIHADTTLARLAEQSGVDFSRPSVVSCGAGVTGCAVALALHLLGKDDVSLYDGSWSEWGRDDGGPAELGEGRQASTGA